jgi:hypothetical protein
MLRQSRKSRPSMPSSPACATHGRRGRSDRRRGRKRPSHAAGASNHPDRRAIPKFDEAARVCGQDNGSTMKEVRSRHLGRRQAREDHRGRPVTVIRPSLRCGAAASRKRSFIRPPLTGATRGSVIRTVPRPTLEPAVPAGRGPAPMCHAPRRATAAMGAVPRPVRTRQRPPTGPDEPRKRCGHCCHRHGRMGRQDCWGDLPPNSGTNRLSWRSGRRRAADEVGGAHSRTGAWRAHPRAAGRSGQACDEGQDRAAVRGPRAVGISEPPPRILVVADEAPMRRSLRFIPKSHCYAKVSKGRPSDGTASLLCKGF